MNSRTLDKINKDLNLSTAKALLYQYFITKGYEPNKFNQLVYPPIIQDLSMIPELSNKIEIIPHMAEMDIITGTAKLGWNLFLLGTKRLYLGTTHHNNLITLARDLRNRNFGLEGQASELKPVKTIVNFIINNLKNKRSGTININPPNAFDQSLTFNMGGLGSSQFFKRTGGFGP